jgi:hypothetical protein
VANGFKLGICTNQPICTPGQVGLVKAASIHVLRKNFFYRLQVVQQIAYASFSRISGVVATA